MHTTIGVTPDPRRDLSCESGNRTTAWRPQRRQRSRITADWDSSHMRRIGQSGAQHTFLCESVFMLKHRSKPTRDVGADLVCVSQVGALEAELIAGRLRAAGIDAAVFGPGTAGENAAIQFAEGARVMVRRRDLERAVAVVDD